MSAYVIDRPLGPILKNSFSAAVTETYGGNTALFTATSHGLTDKQQVYIVSDYTAYNGWWYVTFVSTSTFTLDRYAAFITGGYFTEPLRWVADATVTVYSSDYIISDSNRGGLLASDLPILYTIENTLWPTNINETARSILGFNEDSGYVFINASGAIKSGLQDLDYVKISGASDESLNRVFQVRTAYYDNGATISLPYDSTYNFSGATIQFYYNAYHLRIKVYAGLDEYHSLYNLNPMREMAEIRVTPDENNRCIFSVNNILKSAVTMSNDLGASGWPNYTPHFCRFFIQYAESYDLSDGDEVSTYVSSYTYDIGGAPSGANRRDSWWCVLAKTPFKSIYMNRLSDYAVFNTRRLTNNFNLAKFMTLFDTPVLFRGQVFDIAFFDVYGSANYTIRTISYTNGSVVDTTDTTRTDYDEGLYRILIEPATGVDRVDIVVRSISAGVADLTETKTITVSDECYNQAIYLSWLNYLGAFDYWLFIAEAEYNVSIENQQTTEKSLMSDWPKSYGNFSDTIKRVVSKKSRNMVRVRSQLLTLSQLEAIKFVKTSPFVQIVAGRNDRRTVIIDQDSFKVYDDGDDIYRITFTMEYTDLIPAQTL